MDLRQRRTFLHQVGNLSPSPEKPTWPEQGPCPPLQSLPSGGGTNEGPGHAGVSRVAFRKACRPQHGRGVPDVGEERPPCLEKQVQGGEQHLGPVDTFFVFREEPAHEPADGTAQAVSSVCGAVAVATEGFPAPGSMSTAGLPHAPFSCRAAEATSSIHGSYGSGQRRVFLGLNLTFPSQNKPLGLGLEVSDSKGQLTLMGH